MTTRYGRAPKCLEDAILNALEACPDGPLMADTLRAHVRDYLAQKWATAYLLATEPRVETALQGLWIEVTGEPMGSEIGRVVVEAALAAAAPKKI